MFFVSSATEMLQHCLPMATNLISFPIKEGHCVICNKDEITSMFVIGSIFPIHKGLKNHLIVVSIPLSACIASKTLLLARTERHSANVWGGMTNWPAIALYTILDECSDASTWMFSVNLRWHSDVQTDAQKSERIWRDAGGPWISMTYSNFSASNLKAIWVPWKAARMNAASIVSGRCDSWKSAINHPSWIFCPSTISPYWSKPNLDIPFRCSWSFSSSVLLKQHKITFPSWKQGTTCFPSFSSSNMMSSVVVISMEHPSGCGGKCCTSNRRPKCLSMSTTETSWSIQKEKFLVPITAFTLIKGLIGIVGEICISSHSVPSETGDMVAFSEILLQSSSAMKVSICMSPSSGDHTWFSGSQNWWLPSQSSS